MERLAESFDLTREQVRDRLARVENVLASRRSERPSPSLDDKVLSAWNGLMIGAFARGAQVLGDQRYASAAVDAASFLEENLWDEKSRRLLRSWRDGNAAIDGFAEDYAFVVQGLLDLYETTFDLRWLRLARRIQQRQNDIFWMEDHGYYTLTAGEDESILVDLPGDTDSVLPSHNSVSAMNLSRLGQLTGNDEWISMAGEIMKAFGGTLATRPQTLPLMVSALSARLTKPKQIIIAGNRSSEDTERLLSLVHERYLPDRILILADGTADQDRLSEWVPLLEFVSPIEGRATAYVCENFVCRLPSNDPQVVAEQLDGASTPSE